jgi:SAM-dependent methyltransferase
MDSVSKQVFDFYSKHPYPSPHMGELRLTELANLLKIFSLETGFSLSRESILDAGTGTGYRLIEAAAAYPDCQFVGLDLSEVSINIARAKALDRALTNIEFRTCNISAGTAEHGSSYGMVLSMGVIHYLSDPVRGVTNLVNNLKDDGILFLYVFGKHGAAERLRRKRIVSLLGGNALDFELGINLVKDLGFDSFEYGWDMKTSDETHRHSLIVDAYLNVNHERVYEFDDLLDLLRPSGLAGFAIYGLTAGKQGSLLDVDRCCDSILKSATTRELYAGLTLEDKYRLVDLIYAPNGYTIVGCKAGALGRFSQDSRLRRNFVLL